MSTNDFDYDDFEDYAAEFQEATADGATAQPQVGDSASKDTANLVYILYLVSFAVGITSIIGVIMAYVNKDDSPEWLQTHYKHAIHVFWKGLLYCVVSTVLLAVVVGIVGYILTVIWFIVRCVKGMQRISRNEPYSDYDAWGF